MIEMVSKIPVPVHQFWNRAGMISGAFLVVEAIYAMRTDPNRRTRFRLARICLGIAFMIVDSWFLAHVQ